MATEEEEVVIEDNMDSTIMEASAETEVDMGINNGVGVTK